MDIQYSDDLDIVAPKNSLGALLKWFNYNGYQTVKTAIPNPQNYDGNFIRFSKDEVTVDLLIGAVRDRDAQVDIPASWITRSSVRKKVKGFNYSTSLDGPLARPEALWGLKIQAGRDQDLTDLYLIHDRKFKIGEVTDLFGATKAVSELPQRRITRDVIFMTNNDLSRYRNFHNLWNNNERYARSNIYCNDHYLYTLWYKLI